MSLVINNNLMAMNATRNLNESYGKLATSTRRLSSGLRVGTAADDAAGLAMRELMRADIKTLGQGLRNANDGISMIQTADGGLGVIDAKLIRMKELAEQAATGTYTDVQRKMINQEYQLMANEITRIAQDTDFNSRKLLAGSGQDINVEESKHQGDATRRINADGNTETWEFQGPTQEKVAPATAATGTTLGAIDSNGIQTISASGANEVIEYTSRSGVAKISTSLAASTGAGRIDTKTGEITGVAVGTAKSVLAVSTYEGAEVTIETRASASAAWSDITDTVDSAAGTPPTHNTAASSEVRITVKKADGSVIRDTFTNSTNGVLTIKQGTAGSKYTIETTTASDTALQVKSEVAVSKTFDHVSKTGVKTTNEAVSFFEDNSANLTPASAKFTHDVKTGEIKEAQSVSSVTSSSYGSIKTPVEDFTIETFNETTNTWEKVSLGDSAGDTVDIPESVKKFRITAEYGDYQQVRDTFSNNTGGKFTLTKTQYGLDLGMTDTDPTAAVKNQPSTTQLDVKSEDLVVVNIHFGSGSQETDSYNTYINMATAKSLGVGEAAGDNITTQKNAKKALDNLTIAIRRKDEIRAEIGSTQNRLSATIENVSIQKENLQASESRISDVDVATEMTEFNKVQIMTNAAVSMLAQANSLPKMAQKLLDAR